MKIYKSVTISMATGEVLHEDSYEYDGPVALCGGPSGEVNFPNYMEDQHGHLIDEMELLIHATLTANSPYNGQTAYDPDPIIALNNAQAASFNTLVTALDGEGDWQDAVDVVVNKMRTALPDSAAITTAVEARADRLASAHYAAVGRLASSYGDINAYNHSGFFVALAMLEVEKKRELGDYEAQLALQQEALRLQMIANGMALILGNKHDKVRLAHAGLATYIDMSRQHVIMGKEEKELNVLYSVLDEQYDYGAVLKGGALLGSIQGPQATLPPPSPIMSALSGAASGASLGTSIKPGLGTVIGGVVGAVAGLASSL